MAGHEEPRAPDPKGRTTHDERLRASPHHFLGAPTSQASLQGQRWACGVAISSHVCDSSTKGALQSSVGLPPTGVPREPRLFAVTGQGQFPHETPGSLLQQGSGWVATNISWEPRRAQTLPEASETPKGARELSPSDHSAETQTEPQGGSPHGWLG